LYVRSCNVSERNRMGWFGVGNLEIEMYTESGGKARCLQCQEENEIHILLRCTHTLRWGRMV
jgi:hypothetical protein